MGLFSNKKKEDKNKKGTSKKALTASAGSKKDSVRSGAVTPESRRDIRGNVKKFAPLKSDTGSAYQVLLRPIVTEKSTRLSKEGKYVFEVAMKANKIEIKKAVKNVYGVDPTDVTVLRILGKPKRSRYGRGRTKNWRKAVVTVKKGQSIEVFTTNA